MSADDVQLTPEQTALNDMLAPRSAIAPAGPDPKLTTAQHQERHVYLHRALDELVADWIRHNVRYDGRGRMLGLSSTSIMELMEWSYQQTQYPEG